MRKLKRRPNANQPKRIMSNLRKIKRNIQNYDDSNMPTFHTVLPGQDKVSTVKINKNELEELERLIDDLTQKALNAQLVAPPEKLGLLVEQLARSDQSTLAFSAHRLKKLLQSYGTNVDEFYLNKDTWQTPDVKFQELLTHPQKYKPKQGGSKNAGKRTGVYTFTDKNNQTETLLIKQGANVGETIAEYIGANLYEMTIPEYSARCILVGDKSNPSPTINDVYVASIYEKADTIQDAYSAAGYSSRGMFAGEKARLKHLFNNKESLIRKILDLNDESGHSLEYSAANVLWHGDNDFHTGNTVYVTNEKGGKFVKIDHGFSFFNFGKKVIDIFNPMAGKVMSLSPKKFVKGGKLLEFFPTNHFWDYAIENKQFYFNAQFVKACEEIVNQKPEEIRNNIEKSLNNIQAIYGQNANEAFREFALRIGMKPQQINQLAKGKTDFLRYAIEDHMVSRLIERQASISKLAAYCKTQAAKLDKSRHTISKKLNKAIIKNMDQISKMKSNPMQAVLLKEIALLKLVQQANDLGILNISKTGEFIIDSEFYYHNNGQRQLINADEFKSQMKTMVSLESLKETAPNLKNKTPISESNLKLLREIRLAKKEFGNQPNKRRANKQ